MAMIRQIAVLGLSVILAGEWTAGAAVIRVPADHPTIQAAVNVAFSGDTILVSPGNHAGATLTFPRLPVILGTNPGDPSVVSSIKIAGLIYDGPFNPSFIQRVSGVTLSGAGISINAGGGGSGVTFQIVNCQFEYCDVGLDLLNTNPIRVDVIACSFFANGMGIASLSESFGPIVHVRDSQFEFNLQGINGRFREVRDCRFADNVEASAEVFVRLGDPAGLVFTRNHVSGTSGTGLICNSIGFGSPAVLRIHNNYIVRNGVGLDLPDGSQIDSNTIALNDCVGIVIQSDAATVPIRNTIVYGNGVDLSAPSPDFDLSYCCITQFQAGTGNIAFDPLFEEPAALDFHLASTSPCINRGNPAYDWSIATVDSDNDQRVRGNRIDIGADETPVIGPALLVGDLNGDGLINGLDVQTFVDMLLEP